MLEKINEFDSKREEWPENVGRLNYFLAANAGDDKKHSVLLTVVGAPTYKMLRSLVHTTKPGEKTFAELLAILSQHFKPTLSKIVQHCKLHTRFRQQGETVVKYVVELT